MRDDERDERSAPAARPLAHPVTEAATESQASELGRRELLKVLGATGALVGAHMMLPREWTSPVVDVGALPAHAQTSSGCVSDFTFSAKRNPDKTVTLTWTAPASVDTVDLYRSLSGGGEERFATADAKALSMTDFTASPNALKYRAQVTGDCSRSANVEAAQ
jgi:hypothetical protein